MKRVRVQYVIETHITKARCGKCEHLDYYGRPILPFVCNKRWIMLPSYVPEKWAEECPYFDESWATCQLLVRLGDASP